MRKLSGKKMVRDSRKSAQDACGAVGKALSSIALSFGGAFAMMCVKCGERPAKPGSDHCSYGCEIKDTSDKYLGKRK